MVKFVRRFFSGLKGAAERTVRLIKFGEPTSGGDLGTGFTSTQFPSTPTSTSGGTPTTSSGGGGDGSGSTPIQFSPQIQQQLQRRGLTSGEAQATQRAFQLRLLEQRRGRRFTETQLRKLIGGSKGERDLQRAARKNAGDLFMRALATQASPLVKRGRKALDVLSGGRLTEKDLAKSQTKLNKEVDKFNKRFEGRELPPQEFKRAQGQAAVLEQRQQQIDLQSAASKRPLQEAIRRTSSRRDISGKVTVRDVLRTLGIGQRSDPFSRKGQAQALGAASALASGLITLGETPSAVKSIAKNPKAFVKSLSEVPSSLKSGAVKNAKLFIINPDFAVAKVSTSAGITYFTFKGTGKGFQVTGKLTKKGITKLSPSFKKLETTPLGIRQVRNIPKVGKIEIIEKSGTKIRQVSPEAAVTQAALKKQLKPKPTIPKLNTIQRQILAIVRHRGDAVTGSFAQKVFLKKKFTRKFKDLDILSKNPKRLADAIKLKLGKNVKIIEKTITDSPLGKFKIYRVFDKRGNLIADLDPIRFAEEGFAKKFGTKKVKGLNVVVPESRLAAKVAQLGRGKRGKVVKDIEALFGKKGTPFRRPSFRGAFKFSKKQQAKFTGKKLTLTSSQIDLFKANKIQQIRNLILRKKPSLKVKKWFFATPEIEGVAQARVTRLGLPGKQEASLIDLFSRKATLSKGKPTIFVLPKEKIFKAPKGITRGKAIKTKGFVVPKFSSELEVVLGKGFLIKKGKRLGTTLIDGERVSIIQLKKIKIPKNIKSELKVIQRLNKRLSSKRIKLKTRQNLLRRINNRQTSLNKKIKRATKIDYSSRRTGKRFFPLKRKLSSSALSKLRRRGKGTGSLRLKRVSRGRLIPSRRSPGTPSRGRPSLGSLIRSPIVPGRGSPRISPLPRGRGTPIRRLFVRGSRKTKKLSKAIPTFNVFAKVGRKFVKINKGRLSRADALNRGTFAVDHTVAKTFKLVPAGRRKKIDTLPNIERNYFRRAGFKLREFRIRRGKKFGIRPKFIEKRKFGIDTRGEKRGLTIAKFLKARGFTKSQRSRVERARTRGTKRVNVPRRRITGRQRKVMLRNLAKARRVLARKRK